VAAQQQTRLLKLHQDTVHRSQTDIGTFGQQGLMNVLGTQVAALSSPKQGEDLEPRHRGFESAALEFVGWIHGAPKACGGTSHESTGPPLE